MTCKRLSFSLLLFTLALWGLEQPLVHAQACTEWPTGVESQFCGRGGSLCPDGFECNIASDDSYAVCLPEPTSDFCPPPPDLTGTWEGRTFCTSLRQGEKQRTFNKHSILKMTHIPNSPIRAEIDKALHSGIAAALAKSPHKGAVTFTQCGTDASSTVGNDQMSSANFNIGENRSTMRGKTTWNRFNALTGRSFATTGGTCWFSYKRVSTEDPEIASCPQ